MTKHYELDFENAWIDKIFQWAEDNNLPELEYFEDLWELDDTGIVDEGFWHGLPRNKEALLSMTELNLDWHDLRELPAELGNLKQLTHISFCKEPDGLQARPSPETNNKLTSIPDWVKDLPNLTSVCFSGNTITSIPEGIGKLAKLETLWLSENKIHNIPASIGMCSRLKRLELRSNDLLSIPLSLFKCRELEYLSLDSNKISCLPEGLRKLTRLKELGLAYNCLDSYPDEINRLKNLERLSLSGNLFTKIPSVPTRLDFFDMVSVAECEYKQATEDGSSLLH